MSAQTPAAGRILLVAVHPDDNTGRPESPAIVTGVNDDGTVNVTVFGNNQLPPGQLWSVPVYADRAAAEELLAEQLGNVRDRKADDGTVVKATLHDVTRWVPVAYWPTIAPATPAEEPTEDEPIVDKTPAGKSTKDKAPAKA